MATEKSTSTPGGATDEPSLILAGRNLAVVVLNELLSEGADGCSIETEYRGGLEQCDVLARAIEGLRNAPTAVIRGFAAVFTEIAGCPNITPDPAYFEHLTIQEMGLVSVTAAARH
jgi:hypothetical protein